MRDISSADVNRYLLQVTRSCYTAKDFRTWGGTVAAAQHLAAALGRRAHRAAPTISAAQRNRCMHAAIKAAAEALGNTPTTCRKFYVHPGLADACRDGRLVKAFARARRTRRPAELHLAERAVLHLLNDSPP